MAVLYVDTHAGGLAQMTQNNIKDLADLLGTIVASEPPDFWQQSLGMIEARQLLDAAKAQWDVLADDPYIVFYNPSTSEPAYGSVPGEIIWRYQDTNTGAHTAMSRLIHQAPNNQAHYEHIFKHAYAYFEAAGLLLNAALHAANVK